MRPHIPTALAAALAASSVSSVWAEDSPSYHLSGFGTLGAVQSDEKNADFTGFSTQPNGAGHTKNPAFNVDSKLGGQMDVKFNSAFSATAQAVALQRFDNGYGPELMLGFGKWQAAPEVALRAGRLALPAFLISDYRLVGYSHPWVRPPVDMYHSISALHFDGADATWSTQVGGVALKSQILAGEGTGDVPGYEIKVSHLVGVNLVAESGSSSYRFSYLNLGKFNLAGPALDGAFQAVRFGLPPGALGPGSPALPADPALADDNEVRHKVVRYVAAGYTYDPGDWFATGELGTIPSFGFMPTLKMGYATVGVRRGEWSPYGTLSATRFTPKPLTGNPIVDTLITGNSGRETLGLGMRWDFRKNMDVKFQFDHVKPDAGSAGTLVNPQPGYQLGSTYNVLSATLDFVF